MMLNGSSRVPDERENVVKAVVLAKVQARVLRDASNGVSEVCLGRSVEELHLNDQAQTGDRQVDTRVLVADGTQIRFVIQVGEHWSQERAKQGLEMVFRRQVPLLGYQALALRPRRLLPRPALQSGRYSLQQTGNVSDGGPREFDGRLEREESGERRELDDGSLIRLDAEVKDLRECHAAGLLGGLRIPLAIQSDHQVGRHIGPPTGWVDKIGRGRQHR